MPWRMEQALEILPPSKDRYPAVRVALDRQKRAITRGSPGNLWHGSTTTLPPLKTKIFTRLFENSRRLFGDPDTKLACRPMYDRMVLAGRGTPVDKDLLKAPTCCRYHWLQYQTGKRHLIGAVLPYEDPFQLPTPAPKALLKVRKPDRLAGRVWQDLTSNARVQATVSTVIVRWHKLRSDAGYDPASIYASLRPYGEIESITPTSAVSARVTFTELEAACRAVKARYIGRPDNPLMCLWYHKAMKNKSFYVRKRHLHVAFDPFAT